MANENETSFVLDLDVSEFTEKGLKAKGIIQEIGKAENLSGLLEGLTAAGAVLGTLGLAAFAFKEAIDLTEEGEQIKRVNDQFETLSTQFGIAPKKLKEGLEEASGGLVDTTDLLKIANESIVKMGSSANKLPEIMELARKATQVYGGDAKSNFEAISTAMANGNAKMLKHYGIIIDATDAEKKFAAANGTTANQLSNAGKQQAIMNAALEAGKTAFQGINDDSKSATSTMQQLSVTLGDLKETVILAFEKTMGPTVRNVLGDIANMAKSAKNALVSELGTGSEKTAAQIQLINSAMADTQKRIQLIQSGNVGIFDRILKLGASTESDLKEALSGYQAQLQALRAQQKQEETQEEQATNKKLAGIQRVGAESIVDQEKRLKAEADFRKEMEKIDADYYKIQQTQVQSLDQLESLVQKQKALDEQKYANQRLAIQANENLSSTQKKLVLSNLEKNYHLQAQSQENELAKLRSKLLDNYVTHSTSAFNGIGRAFTANSQKMKGQMNDFGAFGNEVWNSFSSNASSAFQTMGAEMAQGKSVAESTADAMKGFFLGMIGDVAIHYGQMLLLTSIVPPNPIGIAAGIALLALGGALKSLAGSGAAPSTAASSPSVQATASGSAPQLVPVSPESGLSGSQALGPDPQLLSSQQSTPQRTVQVNIAGNYLETDQTKRMLMDLMRQETDATGFQYNQIGA